MKELNTMWKVPFRGVYCETFVGMLKQTLWCHLVIKIFPLARDLSKDALAEYYEENPLEFFEQYKNTLRHGRAVRAS